MHRHPDDDDPWDTPRSIMWAILTVICCVLSIVTRSPVPVLSLAAGAGLWPTLVRASRR